MIRGAKSYASKHGPAGSRLKWSGLKPIVRSDPDGLTSDGPILKPAQWTRHVNGMETQAELKALRHSLARGTLFGDTHCETKKCQ